VLAAIDAAIRVERALPPDDVWVPEVLNDFIEFRTE
jgi:hypothetical protein